MDTDITRKLESACDTLIRIFKSGGKLLLCGNGGSAADCAHITGELCKGFLRIRPLAAELKARVGEPWADRLQGGLPAMDLTANCGLITAINNDIGGEMIFAQQVSAYGAPGDALLGISTSGNSENIRRAMVTARAMGLYTIAMTGRTGGKLANLCDLLLNVDADETFRVQEKQLPLYHTLCARVEAALYAA
jgi:D-sedoheptulose 7-phosphate isomerase